MTTSLPTDITLLLQRGIAAARSGRSVEARQMLQQVIDTTPDNEMAWLWLSGLMTTNEQKRACLEKVLQFNPEHVYARAGLTRLQEASQLDADIMEARLALATSASASTSTAAIPATAAVPTVKPVPKQLSPPRHSNGRAEQPLSQTIEAGKLKRPNSISSPTMPDSASTPPPNPDEPICPACDKPVSLAAKMCPYCFMPFRSVEELLGHQNQAAASAAARRKRRGILAYLGFAIAS